MVASYIKTLKSAANFTNVFRGTYEAKKWLLLFHDHFLCLDKQCGAGDIVPNTREIRTPESKFAFFVSIFQQLEEINIRNRE